MSRKTISLALAFVLFFSVFTYIGIKHTAVPAYAASANVTNFSVTKTKVKSGYKITVKATFPKNCQRRYIGISAAPNFDKGGAYGKASKQTTVKYTTTFTKNDYKKAKKNKNGYVTVYCHAGCDLGGGKCPVKGKNISIKL